MIRLALAQVNPTIGDLEGNASIVTRAISDAMAQGADVVAFPELVITGYPPDDLLLSPAFITDSNQALEHAAKATDGITAIVGCIDQSEGRLYSAAAFLARGRVQAVYHKHHLPNYGVFDERRGTDQLWIACETREKDKAQLEEAIRQAVADEIGLMPAQVC
ncbi:MAG: hypothetical protein KY393_08385, partial [Actinobacteria bacterium]|nr:hypothetical protein [Actinomycetota bacterium]